MPSSMKAERFGVGIVIAAATAVMLWRALANLYVLDDAFISLRYAENLVGGEGLVYNPGEYVEGYTNFLWVLLGALGLAGGLDGFLWVRWLGILAWCAHVPLMALITRGQGEKKDGLCFAFAVLLLLVPSALAGFAGTGMETPLVSMGVLLYGWLQYGALLPGIRRRRWGDLVGLALILTRPDMVIAIAASVAVAVGVALQQSREGAARQLASGLTSRYALTVLGCGLWLGWKLYYYGDVLPNTYYAKSFDSFNADAGIAYLYSWVASYPQVVVLILLGALAAASQSPARNLALFALTALAGQIVYVLKTGGDFMEYRFMHHYYPLLVAAAAPAITMFRGSRAMLGVAFASVALLLSFAPTKYEDEFHMESLDGMTRCCGTTGGEYGKRLAEVLPRSTIIATTMAGGMPYYSRLVTIDQLGLNDRQIAREPPSEPKLRRGHLRYASAQYLEQRAVNLIFDHPVVCPCDDLCAEPGNAYVFVRLDANRCLRSAYLTHTPDLTRLFCEQSHDFVTSGLLCPVRHVQ